MASGTSLRILRERNFALYFIGNLASNCGTWFQVIAQSLLVYRLTASTFLVGLTNFAMFVGVIILAPWSGAAADRFDRRALLILTQVGAALVSAALALLIGVGWGTVPVVIGMASCSASQPRLRRRRCRPSCRPSCHARTSAPQSR